MLKTLIVPHYCGISSEAALEPLRKQLATKCSLASQWKEVEVRFSHLVQGEEEAGDTLSRGAELDQGGEGLCGSQVFCKCVMNARATNWTASVGSDIL